MPDERRNEAEDRHHRGLIAAFESIVSSGHSAVRLLASINGAAMIATLAFAGGLSGKEKPILTSTEPLISALNLFGRGLVFAVAAAGGVYFTQMFYGVLGGAIAKRETEPFIVRGQTWDFWRGVSVGSHIGTVMLCFASFGFFIAGIQSMIDLLRAIIL
jgi:hypothetical protein